MATDLSGAVSSSLEQRSLSALRNEFGDHASIGGLDSCWEWQGVRTESGYGRAWDRVRRRHKMAHRLSYELLRGPIPTGLTLDHLCRNRACCNPRHLEPVTNKENLMRGASFSAGNRRKTHCPHGHEYTDENTMVTNRGWRICRTCHKAELREYKRKRKEATCPLCHHSIHDHAPDCKALHIGQVGC